MYVLTCVRIIQYNDRVDFGNWWPFCHFAITFLGRFQNPFLHPLFLHYCIFAVTIFAGIVSIFSSLATIGRKNTFIASDEKIDTILAKIVTAKMEQCKNSECKNGFWKRPQKVMAKCKIDYGQPRIPQKCRYLQHYTKWCTHRWLHVCLLHHNLLCILLVSSSQMQSHI